MPPFLTLAILSLLCITDASAGDVATFLELPFRYIIGGRSGTCWLTSEEAGRQLEAGTSFRLYSLKGEEGQITAGKASPDQDVCPDVWLVTPDPEVDIRGIAVSAPWNPMPRTAKAAGLTRNSLARRDRVSASGFSGEDDVVSDGWG